MNLVVPSLGWKDGGDRMRWFMSLGRSQSTPVLRYVVDDDLEGDGVLFLFASIVATFGVRGGGLYDAIILLAKAAVVGGGDVATTSSFVMSDDVKSTEDVDNVGGSMLMSLLSAAAVVVVAAVR